MSDIDWSATLLDPLYASLGKPARITASWGGAGPITAIDDTQGIALEEAARGGMVSIQTVKPVAHIRARELASLDLAVTDLDKGTLTLRPGTTAEKNWKIDSFRLEPNPSGENSGEIMLILSEA